MQDPLGSWTFLKQNSHVMKCDALIAPLKVCGTYDGTLQSKTSTIHRWTHRDDWNWSFPTFPEPFVGQSTEGNIEEELDIDGSISFPHEKGDWTWWFTCVITAVSVKCFFLIFFEIQNFCTPIHSE